MPQDRQKLLPYLENLFQQNPLLKQKCIRLAHHALKINSIKRFFNDFPCLVAEEELNKLAVEFENILTRIPENSIKKMPHAFILPEKFQKQIEIFELKIIKQGIEDLIDDEEKVNIAFLDLFKFDSSLDPIEIVSAYVGAINEHITHKVFSESNKDLTVNKSIHTTSKKPIINTEVQTAVYTFLNKNYGKWIEENLDGYVIIDQSNQKSLEWGPPRYAPTLFLFMAMVTGVGTALVMKNHKDACEEKESSFKPSPK